MVRVLANFYFELKHLVNIKVTTDRRQVKDDSQQMPDLDRVVLIYSSLSLLTWHKLSLIKYISQHIPFFLIVKIKKKISIHNSPELEYHILPTRFAEAACLNHILIYWQYFIMHYLIQRRRKKKMLLLQ